MPGILAGPAYSNDVNIISPADYFYFSIESLRNFLSEIGRGYKFIKNYELTGLHGNNRDSQREQVPSRMFFSQKVQGRHIFPRDQIGIKEFNGQCLECHTYQCEFINETVVSFLQISKTGKQQLVVNYSEVSILDMS